MARSARSSTLPGDVDGAGKRRDQTRRISHRHHASHHIHMHRQVARDGAQHLGADLVNFLNPVRSTGSSAAPSRTISRRPSGDAGAARGTFQSAAASLGPNMPQSQVSLHDAEELSRYRQVVERRLEKEYETLSHTALATSRDVDANIIKIRDDAKSVLNNLAALRQVLSDTAANLKRVSEGTIPNASEEHRQQVAALRKTYDDIEQRRLGGLEKRLESSRDRVQLLRGRMEKIQRNVSEWEIKDEAEFRRSKQRHAMFWTVVFTTAALLLLCFMRWRRPRPIHRVSIDDISMPPPPRSIDHLVGDGAGHSRAVPKTKPQEREHPRLRIFDEL